MSAANAWIGPVPTFARPAGEGARSRLPATPTGFFGRERELAVLDELLSGEARLVTLVGPGGAGKTRLALEAARRLAQNAARSGAPRCVSFCDLSSARSL